MMCAEISARFMSTNWILRIIATIWPMSTALPCAYRMQICAPAGVSASSTRHGTPPTTASFPDRLSIEYVGGSGGAKRNAAMSSERS